MPYTDAQIDTMLASKFNASYADSFWLMVCGFLVFFMQCGFALLEAGTCTCTCRTNNYAPWL